MPERARRLLRPARRGDVLRRPYRSEGDGNDPRDARIGRAPPRGRGRRLRRRRARARDLAGRAVARGRRGGAAAPAPRVSPRADLSSDRRASQGTRIAPRPECGSYSEEEQQNRQYEEEVVRRIPEGPLDVPEYGQP